PSVFEWKRWPETEAFVDELLATSLGGNAFAAALSDRMQRETGTWFKAWVDHLVVRGGRNLEARLRDLGYQRQEIAYATLVPVFAHGGGIFPRIVVLPAGANGDGKSALGVSEVAIKAESVVAFSRAHDLGLEIVGYPMGPYRVGRVEGKDTTLAVV